MDEEEPEVVFSMNQEKAEKVEPMYVTVNAEGKKLKMEVDRHQVSGSAV